LKHVATIMGAVLSLLATTQPNAGDRLSDAIRADDLAAVRAALTAGSDVEASSRRITPLALAAIRGNVDIVDALLAAGADPDTPSLGRANALSMAVRSCHTGPDVIDTLIEAGADVENRSGVGITPLMVAIQEKRTDLALLLIEAGADVNTLGPFGDGVLNYAIYVKDTVLIGAALDHGVDTAQLRKLFTTGEYDPPGIADARSRHEVLCGSRF